MKSIDPLLRASAPLHCAIREKIESPKMKCNFVDAYQTPFTATIRLTQHRRIDTIDYSIFMFQWEKKEKPPAISAPTQPRNFTVAVFCVCGVCTQSEWFVRVRLVDQQGECERDAHIILVYLILFPFNATSKWKSFHFMFEQWRYKQHTCFLSFFSCPTIVERHRSIRLLLIQWCVWFLFSLFIAHKTRLRLMNLLFADGATTTANDDVFTLWELCGDAWRSSEVGIYSYVACIYTMVSVG